MDGGNFGAQSGLALKTSEGSVVYLSGAPCTSLDVLQQVVEGLCDGRGCGSQVLQRLVIIADTLHGDRSTEWRISGHES